MAGPGIFPEGWTIGLLRSSPSAIGSNLVLTIYSKQTKQRNRHTSIEANYGLFVVVEWHFDYNELSGTTGGDTLKFVQLNKLSNREAKTDVH